jgi:hypothetical protein
MVGVRNPPTKLPFAQATYGMVAKIPDDAIVDKFMTQLLDVIYTPDNRE